MKVDTSKLETGGRPDERNRKNSHSMLMKTACFALCLAVMGAGSVYQTAMNKDSASADALYKESEANPSFTVQHMGNVLLPDVQDGEGVVTVLMDDGELRHIGTNEDGTVRYVSEWMPLYDEYTAQWNDASSLEEMSFLNGPDGSHAEGYILSEVWFGRDKISENESDFLVLSVPMTDGTADFSRVLLTNNPEHPDLSIAAGGYYVPDADGNYVICIQDGDVVRLMFNTAEELEYSDVNLFDYDVSDGGYYLGISYEKAGEKQGTSGQPDEGRNIYADAQRNGIHSDENYAGDGPKLAFGGSGIGTGLGEEALDGGLDTINIFNYAQQEETMGTGVAKGLAAGIDAEGSLVWSDKISAPDLFSNSEISGKTVYSGEEEYTFVFERNGFSRTLTAVESVYGSLEGLDVLSNPFWAMDTAPSYGTEGHDPAWGSESGNVYYYNGSQAPGRFPASDDGLDHNSFFGFSYTTDFVLAPGYTGPLSFFGCSDDDLWAFGARVDEDGNVMTDTAVMAADLGGVHDRTASYCDLWNVIDRIPYGEEEQHWRLFVFWLERDGSSASCYLNFTLPEAASIDRYDTGAVVIEAVNFGTEAGTERTFIFENGTYDRYHGVYNTGEEITIVSGDEFSIPDGSFLNVLGIPAGTKYTVTETNKARVWASDGDGYKESNTVSGVMEGSPWTSFLSAEHAGTLTIGIDAEGTPDGGYPVRLSLKNAGNIEISAMDRFNNPVGSRFTNADGEIVITLAAGETIVLYGLPEDMEFLMKPEAAAGWHLTEILLDSAEAEGAEVSGSLPAYAIYHYEQNEQEPLQVYLEQSVSSDWTIEDIVLGTGALLSYNITIVNPNVVPVDLTVEDTLPEGLEIMMSSLLNGTADGQTIRWDITLEANSIAEVSFTCQVAAEEACEFNNTAWIIVGDDEISSAAVTARIP